MKQFIHLLFFSGLVALLSGSCNKKILDYNDPNNINTDSYFNTPEQIQEGSTGIYSAFFYNHLMGWRWEEMFDALANEFDGKPAALNSESDVVAFWHYQFNNNNDVITGYWQFLYRIILRANLVLYKGQEYLDKNGNDALVTQSMGEAYCLRGWAYTQLAFYWGRVPIRTSYDQTANVFAPRSATADEVWAVAEGDLKKAQQTLPDTWDDANVGRATSGAATGFLGKLYLYNKKYDSADAEFAKLSARYSLLPGSKWDDNFGETDENNAESVFELQFNYVAGIDKGAAAFGEPEGSGQNPGRENAHAQLYSWTDWANWAFQPLRVKDFQYKDENGNDYTDPRAALTFYGGIGDNTWCDQCSTGVLPYDFATNGYWYRKSTNKEYKASENTLESSNNLRMMRYADVLLMRAECKLFSESGPDVNGAIGYINMVRSRIGAFTYQKAYMNDQAFVLLQKERQVELMGEQSRFNDLKRWGILVQTMNPELQSLFGITIQDKFNLFPIPISEIDSNPGLGPVANGWN